MCTNPVLLNWFVKEYNRYTKTKPDMGKSCVRFKKTNQIPLKLIGELAAKMTPEWITIYESKIKYMKKRVTGIGGMFFKTADPKKTRDWYKDHLGFNTDEYGCTFWWKDNEGKDCTTQWSPFKEDTDYFAPSKKDFMMNFRVENLAELMEILKKEGVTVIDKIEEYEYGKFGWIIDPNGIKIELWEPADQ